MAQSSDEGTGCGCIILVIVLIFAAVHYESGKKEYAAFKADVQRRLDKLESQRRLDDLQRRP